MPEDGSLLTRYADEKSAEAFAELVSRHIDLVFSVALRELRGDHARAQDVTQQVFFALLRKAPALKRRSTIIGWLHITTHHAAAELMRNEQRRKRREEMAAAIETDTRASADDIDWDEVNPMLNAVIEALPDTDREAVLLRFYARYSFAEIGRALRLSDDAAQKRVSRAIERMRDAFARRGISSSSAALAALLEAHAIVAAPSGLAASIVPAAVAASSGGALTTFTVMSVTKMQVGIAAVFLSAALGIIVYQYRTNTELRVAAHRLEVENRRLATERQSQHPRSVNDEAAGDADVRTGTQSGHRTTPQPGSSTNALTRTSPSGAENFVPTSPPVTGRISTLGFGRDSLENSHLADAGLAATSAWYARKYQPFFDAQGIPNELQGRLEEIEMQRKRALMDLATATIAEHLDDADPAVKAAAQRIEDGSTEAIHQALGPTLAAKYDAYSNTLSQRDVVAALASMVYSDSPITASQADQLVSILSQNFAGKTSGSAYGNMATVSAVISDSAIEQARAILSPQQVAALRRLQDLQRTQLIRQNPSPSPTH